MSSPRPIRRPRLGSSHRREVAITTTANPHAAAMAAHLAKPPARPVPRERPQYLGSGAAGIALLHVERAATGLSSWDTAHAWLAAAAREPISAGPNASLYTGVPALAFALHGASSPRRYSHALGVLDTTVAKIIRQRLDQAHARIDRGDHPTIAEFDLINGLTGLGAHLLRRDPQGEQVRHVLDYLTRLTEPLAPRLPGWWSSDQPGQGVPSPRYAAGHSNHGMAHGIAGPLALMSLAMLRGITVTGLTGALLRICCWLDDWQQESHYGPWWPETVTIHDLANGMPGQASPGRPSWCYGTPGLFPIN